MSSKIDLFRPGLQSALHPHGPQADALATLALVMTIGAAVVFIAVLVLTARAVWRPLPSWASSERFVIGAGLVVPVVVLGALLVYVMVLSRVFAAGERPADVTIEIIGEQFWWRVHYLDAQGAVEFATANEVHIPAGRSVDLLLKSADVIHSLWVPGLAGKADLFPGRVHRIRVSTDRVGVLRGQCAEFCGSQHAQMALYVVAEDEARFAAWRQHQLRAAETTTSSEGRALFEAHCGVCHTVRGTAADGTLGPDLTHIGSRMSIAAGMLPNNVGTMAAWIAGSQQIKPGNLMPSMNVVGGAEIRALASYLEQLD
jgi:cytochrome c oxidase subunit 2